MPGIKEIITKMKWNTSNIKLGKRVIIEDHVKLSCNYKKDNEYISIGDNSFIRSFSILETYGGYIRIGKNSTINYHCVLYGHGGLDIGDHVGIGAGTIIIPANHNHSKIGTPMMKQRYSAKGITICDDVWIGANTTILDGVILGTGCIVGAGAVVTKNVLNYEIVGGVPARHIGDRENYI